MIVRYTLISFIAAFIALMVGGMGSHGNEDKGMFAVAIAISLGSFYIGLGIATLRKSDK